MQHMVFLGCRRDSRIYMAASTTDLLDRLGQFHMGPFLNLGLYSFNFFKKSEYLIPISLGADF